MDQYSRKAAVAILVMLLCMAIGFGIGAAVLARRFNLKATLAFMAAVCALAALLASVGE